MWKCYKRAKHKRALGLNLSSINKVKTEETISIKETISTNRWIDSQMDRQINGPTDTCM